jgi:MFS family permease
MPSVTADHSKSRLATRLSFAAAGFGVDCWAPLVPFAKARLGIGDGTLGFLLLCPGAGSVAAMPITGILATKFGSKPIIRWPWCIALSSASGAHGSSSLSRGGANGDWRVPRFFGCRHESPCSGSGTGFIAPADVGIPCSVQYRRIRRVGIYDAHAIQTVSPRSTAPPSVPSRSHPLGWRSSLTFAN